jgi:chromate transporter
MFVSFAGGAFMGKMFELFMIFLKIGAFTLGGGYAMVPLIQDEVCSKKKWTTDEEFLNIIAIAQSLPGALAVNTASILGYKLFGIAGVLVAVLGTIIPSFVIILVIAIFFNNFASYGLTEKIFQGIRPAVVALIGAAAITLGKKVGISCFNLAVGAVTLALLLLDVHPILIIVAAGALGVLYEYMGGNKHAKADN